jgi:HPr kinase/phosphorylase
MSSPQSIAGTSVALHVEGALRGVLLRGPSGVGKSDLALRLIDQGALLVADDQTLVSVEGGGLIARAPESVRGRIEARGLGIVAVPSIDAAPLVLVVDLARDHAIERLPHAEFVEISGVALPHLKLNGIESSAPAKIRLAVQALNGGQHAGVTFPFASG